MSPTLFRSSVCPTGSIVSSLSVLVVTLLLHSTAEARTAQPELPAAAEALSESLFEMLDQGRLRETYALTAPVVRGAETESSWYGQVSSERESMGDALSRRLARVEKLDRFADLPRGVYLIAVYDTSFTTHPESQEIVVMVETDDGRYELAGYRVRYDMWPEAVGIIGNGLVIVFFIMALLASITWVVGKIMQVTAKPEASGDEDKKG